MENNKEHNTGKRVPFGTQIEGHDHLENDRAVKLAMQLFQFWQAQQQGSAQSNPLGQDFKQRSTMSNVGCAEPTSPQSSQPCSPVVGSLKSVVSRSVRRVGSSMRGKLNFGRPVGESGRGSVRQREILDQYTGMRQYQSGQLGDYDDFNDGLPNNLPDDAPQFQDFHVHRSEQEAQQYFPERQFVDQQVFRQPQFFAQQQQQQQNVNDLANLLRDLNVGLDSSTDSNVQHVEPVVEPTFGVIQQPQQQPQVQQQQVQFQQPLIDLHTQVPVGEGFGGIGNGPSLQPREVKLERPSTFNGKHADLDNFVFEMKQYIDSVGLGSGNRACRFFVSYLKGDAATWWRTYSMSKSRSGNVFDNLDLDTLVDELTTQFTDVDKLMHVRDRLFKLRQTGKVSHYTAVFRRLQIELGDERVDDETAKYLYTQGLQHEVRKQVLLHRPSTFEDTVWCAERAGQAFELSQVGYGNSFRGGSNNYRGSNNRGGFGGNRGGFSNFRGGSNRGGFGGYRGGFDNFRGGNRGGFSNNRGSSTQFSDHPYKGPGPMALGALEKQLLALTGGQQQQKAKSNVACWYCGKTGHVKKQCFKWQHDQQSGASGSGQQQGNVAQQLAAILSGFQGQQQSGQQQQKSQDKGKDKQQPSKN